MTGTDDLREDIQNALEEMETQIAMARIGTKMAEGETSERRVRAAVSAIRGCLEKIEAIAQEVDELVKEALEPETKLDAPQPAPSSRRSRRQA